ncbi:MAG TPA: hypothetical protein VF659_00440 [Pyrinomonadaceae bacterium]
MKKFIPLLLLLLSPAPAPDARAQEAAAPADPGVEVVKHGWSKERINWERDPFAGPLESFDDARMRMRNEKRIEDAKRGSAPETDRLKTEARADDALIAARHRGKPARYVFSYRAAFRNGGGKPVREVDWDYVFFDAATGQEVGRHRFTSEGRLDPGKKREFGFLIAAPPAKTISVQSLNDRERDGISGRVVLVRVLYADGTVWRRPEQGPP